MSKKQIEYLNHIKKQKIFIKIIQVSIAILFFIIWEVMAKLEIINSFITSSPTEIIKTIFGLFKSGELFHHIWVTLSEALIAFFIVGIVSILISIILYENKTLSKIVDPYLTILNSLPKVALGPILIIWRGANKKRIILMAVLISIIGFVLISTITNTNPIIDISTVPNISSIDNSFISIIVAIPKHNKIIPPKYYK